MRLVTLSRLPRHPGCRSFRAGAAFTSPPKTAELFASFLKDEKRRESFVRTELLGEKSLGIIQAHSRAVHLRRLSYEDPESGLRALTTWRHYLKGNCCGNACRHCIFDHVNVPEGRRKQRKFNSAFWHDVGDEHDVMEEPAYPYEADDLDRFLEVAVRLVKEASTIIEGALGKDKVAFELKDSDCKEGIASSVLTVTDTAVEKHLVAGLSSAFPDHAFIGEEDISASPTGMIENFTNRPTWIIDPIDGTMNFVHRNPLVCTSVGLTINKKLVLGVVNSPITGHLYTAISGKGAYLNGSLIKTSGVKKLSDAMVLMELPVGANEVKKAVALRNVTNLMGKAQSIRCPGPAALDIAWVGGGSADGFFHFGIHCWDMAAGAVIVREAGGAVIGHDGKDFDLMGRGIVTAATRELALELAKNIEVYSSPERDLKEPCYA